MYNQRLVTSYLFMFWSMAKLTGIATIPYNKGPSETIAWMLQPYSIRVAHKPITTLLPLRINIKDRLTEPKTGSHLQDQMLRLPGHLYW